MSSVAPTDTPIYEVRAMSLAEILDTSFQLIKNAFVLLGGLAAIVYLPLSLFLGVITVGMDLEGMEPEQIQEAAPMLVTVFGLYTVVALAGFPFVIGAITGVAGHLYLGHAMTLGDAVRLGLGRFLPLLGTYFLFGLLLGGVVAIVAVLMALIGSGVVFAIGTLAIICLYLYAMPAMVLMPQVVVLEESSGMAGVRRSWDLAKGVRWRILGVLFTAGFLIFIPISGMQMLMNVIPVVGAIAWGVAQSVGFAFTSAAQVVLYFDIRCRKEAFDLEHLAQLVEGQGAPPDPIG